MEAMAADLRLPRLRSVDSQLQAMPAASDFGLSIGTQLCIADKVFAFGSSRRENKHLECHFTRQEAPLDVSDGIRRTSANF